MPEQIINYRITNGSIVRVMLWVALAYSIFFFRELLVTLLVGLVIASTIDPIAKYFEKYKIPRVATVGVIFLAFFSAISLFIMFVLPTIADDLAKVIAKLPAILEQFRVFGRDMGFKDLSIYLGEMSKDISKGQILTILKNSVVGAAGVAKTTGAVIGNLVNFALMLVFSFYLAVQENGIKNFLKLITPKFYEKYIIDLWVRSERKIGYWAKGQIIVALIISTLVFTALTALGVPYAAVFALLAFIGQMIPVVGIILPATPAVAVAYFTGDISLSIMTLIAFFVISQLENYVITPKIMNSMIGVPAIVVLIAVIVGAKLAGFWGVLIAVPIAAIFMELVNDILQDKIPSPDKKDYIVYE
jgi:predicted PurR-regulated permease PerM